MTTPFSDLLFALMLGADHVWGVCFVFPNSQWAGVVCKPDWVYITPHLLPTHPHLHLMSHLSTAALFPTHPANVP